jgi:hypothetical protein
MMQSERFGLFLASVVTVLILFSWKRFQSRISPSLPPGPRPLPFLGNLTDFRAKELWLLVSEWARQYGAVNLVFSCLCLLIWFVGDVVYLHVLGQGIIILNTAEAASDLLDNKGSIYSHKPRAVMVGEL